MKTALIEVVNAHDIHTNNNQERIYRTCHSKMIQAERQDAEQTLTPMTTLFASSVKRLTHNPLERV